MPQTVAVNSVGFAHLFRPESRKLKMSYQHMPFTVPHVSLFPLVFNILEAFLYVDNTTNLGFF